MIQAAVWKDAFSLQADVRVKELANGGVLEGGVMNPGVRDLVRVV